MKDWKKIVTENLKLSKDTSVKINVDYMKLATSNKEVKVYVAMNEAGFKYLESSKVGGTQAKWDNKLSQPWNDSPNVFVVYMTNEHKYITEVHPLMLRMLHTMDETGQSISDKEILKDFENVIQKNKRGFDKLEKHMLQTLQRKTIDNLSNSKKDSGKYGSNYKW